MQQVSNWLGQNEKINSEYGIVRYRDWCEFEAKRLQEGNEIFIFVIKQKTRKFKNRTVIAIFKKPR